MIPSMDFINVLVCDIGGTNLRMSLVQVNTKTLEKKEIKNDRHRTNEYKSFHDFYTSKFMQEVSKEFHPQIAVLGVAGTVLENKAYMSHISWRTVDGNELAQQLNLSQVVLLNDLEAIALGITTLDQKQLIPLTNVVSAKQRPSVVVCPGTGLGAAYLVPDFRWENSYEAWPSETGHANHGPGGSLQHEYYEYLRKKYNLEWIWVEKVVCGKAIVDIFEFLKQKKRVETPEIEKAVESAKDRNDALNKVIFESALAGKDEICKETLNLFIEIIATEVSNLALRFLPQSGIYLAGGIINYISEYLMNVKDSVFLPAYFLKEPVLINALKQIPIYIVKCEADDLGLKGCINKVEKIMKSQKKD